MSFFQTAREVKNLLFLLHATSFSEAPLRQLSELFVPRDVWLHITAERNSSVSLVSCEICTVKLQNFQQRRAEVLL
jgi:hypothetical protein